jgi:hypothetical protein
MNGMFDDPVARRAKALAAVAVARRALGQKVGTDAFRSTAELEALSERLRRKVTRNEIESLRGVRKPMA